MKQRVITVVGVSGIGKTTHVKRLAEQLPIQHLTAGTLIEDGRSIRSFHRDQLRLASIDGNQKLLIEGFRLARDPTKPYVVIDGHPVVHGPQGLEDLSAEVFGALSVDAIVHLLASPEKILMNRVNDDRRKRPVLTKQEIFEHQTRSVSVAKAICRSLSIPYLEVGSDDIETVKSFFLELS